MSDLTTELEQDSLYFIPLGGAEQFGVNLNVYASNGRFLVVDCGIGFADERFPGIDLLLPDPAFLEERAEDIEALIITHAHEDHVGAVPYLWDRLRCPIYTTAFTAEVLRRKFMETKHKNVPIHVVEPLEILELEEFKIKFVPVAHSVPDTSALIIETAHGRLVHSGDWNLDPKPVLGLTTDSKPFKDAAKAGVLAYIGDSTNAEVPGRAGSESDVEKGLEVEFKKCKKRIAVTIFSSNIGRIISIAKAAQKCGRDVGLIGRSLHNMVGAAYECGLLDDIPDFVSEEDLGFLPEDKTVMIVTGSQGENRSALAKISRGDHHNITLNKGDTVIFSARAIPGNDRNINTVKNNLSAGGINIVTPSDTSSIIHVSGHPCRDEIADMYQWVRPGLVIPVHGERSQLDAQAAFATECQVGQTIVPNNGSLIKLAPGTPQIVDHVQTGVLAVDQKRIIHTGHKSITERRKLQYSGTVHLAVVLDADGEVVGEPKIDTVGLIDQDSAEIQIEENLHEEVLALIEDLDGQERLDDSFISEQLRIGVRRFIFNVLGVKPKASIHVMRV